MAAANSVGHRLEDHSVVSVDVGYMTPAGCDIQAGSQSPRRLQQTIDVAQYGVTWTSLLITKVQYRRLYFRNLDESHLSATLISWAQCVRRRRGRTGL